MRAPRPVRSDRLPPALPPHVERTGTHAAVRMSPLFRAYAFLFQIPMNSFVSIDVTNECNMRCTHCYFFEQDHPEELTDDLISMTRSELRLKTRAALHQATGENRQAIVHGARVKRGESVVPVAITVTPLQQPPLVAGLLLVTFHLAPEEARVPLALDVEQGPEGEIVRQMEDELKTTRA